MFLLASEHDEKITATNQESLEVSTFVPYTFFFTPLWNLARILETKDADDVDDDNSSSS